jgi:hypothetical protein
MLWELGHRVQEVRHFEVENGARCNTEFFSGQEGFVEQPTHFMWIL